MFVYELAMLHRVNIDPPWPVTMELELMVYPPPPTHTPPLSSVTVSLKPAGNAPTLNKSKFLVERERTVGWLHQWLKKALKCDADESIVSLHNYVFLISLYVCVRPHHFLLNTHEIERITYIPLTTSKEFIE